MNPTKALSGSSVTSGLANSRSISDFACKIALAQYALIHARSWTVECINPQLRQTAKLDQARQEIAMTKEQIPILHARMESIPRQRRSHYPPVERLATLELKVARC